MKARLAVATLVAVGVLVADVAASGRIGFYGIIEKVIFEPNETAPERIQVWGAFMYVDVGARSAATSTARRGYLYFRIGPNVSGTTPQSQIDLTRKEWADLKAIAGTGQAIGFGQWGYIGSFGTIAPDRESTSVVVPRLRQVGERADVRVRPDGKASCPGALSD